MNKEKILLSISMLVSGREEMAKSLDSLHYFKEAFPCEIILVDTGCNAEQRALVERYADKVVDFTWCGDFAAARNAGLKEARGEWFMYLDDDEWFENPREIVAFFTSDEHTKYNCASYAVRNYFNFEGTMYDDSYPSRMCRLEPTTRFIGKIHEFISTFKAPKKVFSDFVHHYGYVYKDDAEKQKHTERNIKPLLEMVEQYPMDPRWSGQLAQEYHTVGKYEEAYETSRKWLEEDRKKYAESVNSPIFIGCLYAFALISLDGLKWYDKEEEWLDKALADPILEQAFMEPTAAFFHLVGARVYGKQKKDEQCREHMSKYMDSYRRLKDDRQALERGADLIIASVFQKNLLYGTVLSAIGSLIRVEDYALAEEAFYALEWEDKKLLNQFETERDIVDAVCSVDYHPLWGKILQTLVARDGGMKEMLVAFLDVEVTYKRYYQEEKLSRLRYLVSRLDFEHSYVLCSKILWTKEEPKIKSEEARRQQMEEMLRQLFQKYSHELFEIRTEVWNALEKTGLLPLVDSLVRETDYLVWKHSVEIWCSEADLTSIKNWDARIAGWRQTADIRYDLFGIKCLEGYLYHYKNAELKFLDLEKLLWRYADSVIEFYKPYYKETAFEKVAEALPEDIQLALRLKTLQRYRKQGNDLKALEAVRKCLGVYPALGEVITDYAGMLRDDVKRRDKEAEAARSDLEKVVASLKDMARQRLEQGEPQAAKEILEQVCQCAPEDKEAGELLKQAENNLQENSPEG